MKAWMVGSGGARVDQQLDGTGTSIGRGSDNDIVVAHPQVSRHHATISFQGGTWILEDHSSNGTMVGVRRVHRARIPLRGGERISFAKGAPVIQIDSSPARGPGIRGNQPSPAGPPSSGTAKVQVIQPDGSVTERALNRALSIGRTSASDIVVNGSKVSRHHATLSPSGAGYILEDHSTNGTYVDGRRVHNSSVSISPGQEVTFGGRSAKLVVRPSSPPAPRGSRVPRQQGVGARTAAGPSHTKIVPIARRGFFDKLKKQWFFHVGLVTSVVSVILFSTLLSFHQGLGRGIESGSFMTYAFTLGLYLGYLMILFLYNVSGKPLGWTVVAGSFAFTFVLLLMQLPFQLFSVVFRPRFVMEGLEGAGNIFELFMAHFIGAGLCEELFKSIPIWLAAFAAPWLSRNSVSGFRAGKLTPLTGSMVGAASGVAFIVFETVMSYVPNTVNQTGMYGSGIMLLLPRFLNGMAAHVAWSGIFGYFIGLYFFHRCREIKLVFYGYLGAALLHGLSNSFGGVHDFFMGAMYILSFVAYFIYLYKARLSYHEG